MQTSTAYHGDPPEFTYNPPTLVLKGDPYDCPHGTHESCTCTLAADMQVMCDQVKAKLKQLITDTLTKKQRRPHELMQERWRKRKWRK